MIASSLASVPDVVGFWLRGGGNRERIGLKYSSGPENCQMLGSLGAVARSGHVEEEC